MKNGGVKKIVYLFFTTIFFFYPCRDYFLRIFLLYLQKNFIRILMKRTIIIIFLILSAFLNVCGKSKMADKIIVAYVTSWSKVIPDPFSMTHINYAFGHVNETFNGVRIDNEKRLHEIVALKKQNPNLRVLLSVGGWGSGRFSEMASDSKLRIAFAKDCKRITKEFDLDGIDIDWEYPTQNSANISSSPQDIQNFTLLMRDLRKVLGPKQLVTCATVSDGKYYDLPNSIKYMDFVNVMAYDMANPPKHHSALYKSPFSGWNTSHGAIESHLKLGVPTHKLVLGMPFYGRGKVRDYYRNRGRYEGEYVEMWDEQGLVPYLLDKKGEMVLGFENPRSLSIKCQYILDRDLLGAMYWEYSDDNCQGDERRTLYQSLLENKKATIPAERVLVMAERGTGHEGFVVAAKKWLDAHASEWNLVFEYVSDMKNISTGQLDTYHLILQLNYPPYAWSKAAASDFEQYIEEGKGGYIGLHHATLLGDIFDGNKMWQWFSEFMGGIRFKSYIETPVDGAVQVEDINHPIMEGVPATFFIPDDEWYTYDCNPRPNVLVLAHVDEFSYRPSSDIRMGDHPVVWVNPKMKARNVYFQMGHSSKLLENPEFCRMFENAIKWALRR